MSRCATVARRALLLLILLHLAVHLPLLAWHPGEYTDGILQLTLDRHDNAYYPPLFYLLTLPLRALGLAPLLAGRVIAAIAAALTLWPVAALGREAGGHRGALLAAVLWLAAPLANRWALHGMADTLCTLLVAGSLVCALHAWRGNAAHLGWFFALAGLATLAKYQGVLLLAGLPLLLYRHRGLPRAAWPATGLALLAWAALAGWLALRGFAEATLVHQRNQVPFQVFATFGAAFLRWLPWGLGYAVTVLAAVGLLTGLVRRQPLAYSALGFGLVLWLLQTFHLSFQLRYFLPLVPLVCALAAGGVLQLQQRINHRLTAPLLAGLALACGLTTTAGVWQFQRYSWAALADTARAVPLVLAPGQRLFADERYDASTPPNVKVRFFSGRDAVLYYYAPGNRAVPRRDIRAGDAVLLNSLYSNVARQHEQLSRNFRLIPLAGREYDIRPLLPDLMQLPQLTSHPYSMRQRGRPQHFFSVLYQLEAR